MLTSRTKRQLIVFVLLGLVGISYVGARYARLDRLVFDTSYDVTVQLHESGGIYEGAEVDYRGVRIGTVGEMELTRAGVDVHLKIDRKTDAIPEDTLAVVTNRSAVGEQYVDLQPRRNDGPTLGDGSVIPYSSTEVPISASELLTNLDRTVSSVPQKTLRTTVTELGSAFAGTGDDLGRLIDYSGSFLDTAEANLEVTTSLIRTSRIALRTQVEKGSAIQSFSADLAQFTGTLSAQDEALRKVIDDGSATVNELRTFLELNEVDLGSLIRNVLTTSEVVSMHLPGIRQMLVIFPYQVASFFTVLARTPSGDIDFRLGLALNPNPRVCRKGYPVEERRPPTDGSNRPQNVNVQCLSPQSVTVARGSRWAPRPGVGREVATYDIASGQLVWKDQGQARGKEASLPALW